MQQRARRETQGHQSFAMLAGASHHCIMAGEISSMGTMGPLKSFGDLQDSILKLRENFDAIILSKRLQESPLKKKDLLNEFEGGGSIVGIGNLKE